ncbi:AlpA family phage regulatory protein [Moraxella nasovis]|uniref:helix-turn-helix transcriptional regulator n=1 Tax=Moraxella nasovis TaxID=2904121 RepID=UPI001F612385|nr:AlpA family phage regulatory protein [Moraxella nasovis]UNU73646.1 AlpA family phage regulatory protein [Moraxella nasovis]
MKAIQPTLPKGGLSTAKAILPLLPFSRTTLWRKCNDGTFPKPIRLSSNSTAWRNDDVLAWLKNPNEWGQA